MTSKMYKSARGKPVDIGALRLQNEKVRAVGNKGVNARGDLLDSNNNVIDPKNRQVQRQYKRQVSSMSTEQPVQSANAIRGSKAAPSPLVPDVLDDPGGPMDPPAPVITEPDPIVSAPEPDPAPAETPAPVVEPDPVEEPAAMAPVAEPDPVVEPAPVVDPAPADPAPSDAGGLAAAIARSRVIKQEKEKTAREQAKLGPLKKI